MSELSKLMGKSETFNIGGIDITFSQLTLDELDVVGIDKNAPVKDQMIQMKELIRYCLKKAVPEATDDELKGLSMEHMPAIQEAIMKLNKMGDKAAAKWGGPSVKIR